MYLIFFCVVRASVWTADAVYMRNRLLHSYKTRHPLPLIWTQARSVGSVYIQSVFLSSLLWLVPLKLLLLSALFLLAGVRNRVAINNHLFFMSNSAGRNSRLATLIAPADYSAEPRYWLYILLGLFKFQIRTVFVIQSLEWYTVVRNVTNVLWYHSWLHKLFWKTSIYLLEINPATISWPVLFLFTSERSSLGHKLGLSNRQNRCYIGWKLIYSIYKLMFSLCVFRD